MYTYTQHTTETHIHAHGACSAGIQLSSLPTGLEQKPSLPQMPLPDKESAQLHHGRPAIPSQLPAYRSSFLLDT